MKIRGAWRFIQTDIVEWMRPYSEVIDRVLETSQPKGNQDGQASV